MGTRIHVYIQHHFVITDGEPIQLNYSSDDGNVGDDEFANIGSVPDHFNDEFSTMNDQTDVFGDNLTAVNTYRYNCLWYCWYL